MAPGTAHDVTIACQPNNGLITMGCSIFRIQAHLHDADLCRDLERECQKNKTEFVTQLKSIIAFA